MRKLRDIEEASISSLRKEWKSLEVDTMLADVLQKEFKFANMTPVQAATIPLMLKSKDVIVNAKTGSGKTLAFIIPIIELLLRHDKQTRIETHDVLAVILSPTRELATQIHQVLRKILRNPLLDGDRKLASQLIVGGPTVASSIEKYNKFGGNIVVATPGRMSAIMEMADNNLSSSIRKKLKFLVLDEADQLLSLGFELNLSSILNYLPKQRRTSLFSATQTKDIDELIKSGLRNPILVNVSQSEEKSVHRKRDDESDPDKKLLMPNNLSNFYHICETYIDKIAVVAALATVDDYKKVLVFLSTCAQVDYFSTSLENTFKEKGINLLRLHRRLKNKRKSIFNKFKKSKRCVLLATDIVSRGIDVTDISLVVHVDLPASPECYVHRSGRSGHQIDLSGISLLLLQKYELDYIEMCRRRQINLEPISLNHLSTQTARFRELLSKRMRTKASKDESYQTLGVQAFVSYVRFYSAKLCIRQILFPRINIVELATSFGLVRLPRMPELKKNHKALAEEFEVRNKTALSAGS